ncbi:LuxR C-terminal-related transcriptional regulator [Qipengyuania sp. DSG2-2]|uniref:LuxR C-terminal-related transcriptional regulator n=1 Tax=Qipengyuania sp. DGS2-2 TaxID=3349631 RepID=UPI0036D22E64
MTLGRSYSTVIADDHAIIRQALSGALSDPDAVEGFTIEVCEEVGNGIEAIGAMRKHRPDLLMLDVSMPHAGGTEVLLEARRWSPDTKVIVFTGIAATGKIAEIVDAGADGVFCKSDDLAELTRAVPRILQGARIICARYLALLDEAIDVAPLTDRERQVLNLVVAGRTNREIAETLGISAKTVDRHRTNMMAKTGAHSATELVAFALREGLIDPLGSQA